MTKIMEITSVEQLFDKYYNVLCNFALSFVNDDDLAEDIVQETFVKFWETSKNKDIKESAKSYLYMMVKNRCLNHIEHLGSRDKYKLHIESTSDLSVVEEDIDVFERKEKLYQAIEELPESRKKIIQLSCVDGLKYSEIAEDLGISKNTVKTQISLAYKYLRSCLDAKVKNI